MLGTLMAAQLFVPAYPDAHPAVAAAPARTAPPRVGRPVSPAQSFGDAAYHRGDFDAAQSAYATALAADPNDANALLGLGTIDLYSGKLDEARTYLGEAARRDPGDTRATQTLRALERLEPKPGDMQIAMAPKVEIPFVVTDPLPMIRATIDGRPATLVVDTGATTIALSAAAAKRIGVDLRPAGEGVFAGGRTARVFAGRIESIAFPGLTVRGIPASGLPAAMPASLGGHRFDGIIGTTMLRAFLATLDYRENRLILRPRSASAAFEQDATERGDAVVPMWLVPDHFIFVRARVNETFDGLFSVDTGGAGVGITLADDVLSAAHVVPDRSKAFRGAGGGGEVLLEPFTARSVSVGHYTRRDVPGVYSPAGQPYGIFPFAVSGAISHQFFRDAAVSFDFDAMKMVVTSR